MTDLLPLALAALFAVAGPVPGVPAPPEGKLEQELSQVAAARAQEEMTRLLAELEKDPSQSAVTKAEVKAKLSRLKIAIYTTPRSVDECVTFYAGKVKGATFLFAERQILPDLIELSQGGRFQVTAEMQKAAEGKSCRYARWSRDDGELWIGIEDHLIDPRDGKVTKQTVVMVNSMAE